MYTLSKLWIPWLWLRYIYLNSTNLLNVIEQKIKHLIVILLVSNVGVLESLDTKKVFILVYSQLSSELIRVKVCCYFLSNISCCSAQDDTNVLV